MNNALTSTEMTVSAMVQLTCLAGHLDFHHTCADSPRLLRLRLDEVRHVRLNGPARRAGGEHLLVVVMVVLELTERDGKPR